MTLFCKMGARDMTATRQWALNANAGDYLIQYATCGITAEDAPGSLCGYAEPEIAQLDAILSSRNMALRADDIGLVVSDILI